MKLNVRVIVSLILLFCGLILIFTSENILKFIIKKQLVLTRDGPGVKEWIHLSEKQPVDFFLFHWTNPDDIYNHSIKPKFEELGPYRFKFDMSRVNVTWNSNGTVTYRLQKNWFYHPENGTRNLNDTITIISIPALGAAHVARQWNYLSRRGLSLTINSLYSSLSTTRTVDEVLFQGYDDPLVKMSATIFSGTNYPKFEKFGFFFERNGSSQFDGVYNMGTGINSTFGKLYSWNYKSEILNFGGECIKIDASSGDRYDTANLDDTIRLYLPDFCRPLILEYVGKTEIDGIPGLKYTLGDRTLDNGTKYLENRRYCGGECVPSGILNTSMCHFDSPFFLSLPHFYNADSYYNMQIGGLHPNKHKHEFYIVIEPNTGIPLLTNARTQLNVMLYPIADISKFENVPKHFFPLFWVDQEGKLPKDELTQLKLLLKLPFIFNCFGVVLIILALLVVIWSCKKQMKQNKKQNYLEEDILLKLKTLN